MVMFSFTETSLRLEGGAAAVLELGTDVGGAGLREEGMADSSTGSGSGRLKLKVGASPPVVEAGFELLEAREAVESRPRVSWLGRCPTGTAEAGSSTAGSSTGSPNAGLDE